MTTEQAIKEKLHLTIINVATPKSIGDKGARKLEFKAKSPDGRELQYFTFTAKLFNTIVKDASFDADVETSERTWNDQIYTDRKVTQIYKDGQAVAGQKGGWQRNEDSPEKRASIERQTCLNAAVALACADIQHGLSPSMDRIIDDADAMFQWVNSGNLPLQTSSPSPAKPSEVVSTIPKAEAPVQKPLIDMKWLRTSLATLGKTEAEMIIYLTKTYNLPTDNKGEPWTLEAALASLTPLQQKSFVQVVEKSLKAKK